MTKSSASALAFAVTLGLAATFMSSGGAQAMTLTSPQAIKAAVGESTAAEQVALVCRRVWRCGPWGCGWRRACWNTPGYGYGAWGYGPRPYWGPRYHRPWRRW